MRIILFRRSTSCFILKYSKYNLELSTLSLKNIFLFCAPSFPSNRNMFLYLNTLNQIKIGQIKPDIYADPGGYTTSVPYIQEKY